MGVFQQLPATRTETSGHFWVFERLAQTKHAKQKVESTFELIKFLFGELCHLYVIYVTCGAMER